MIIQVPIFDNSQIIDYKSIDLNLPYCVGSVTDVRFKFKIFTENESISITKIWKEQHYIINSVDHSVCNDETEKSKILGNRFYQYTFMRPDVLPVSFLEVKPCFDAAFNELNDIRLSIVKASLFPDVQSDEITQKSTN